MSPYSVKVADGGTPCGLPPYAREHRIDWRNAAHWSAIASLIALTFLCLLWEAVLAPSRPGGSFLMLKALPLLLPLFGVLRERIRAYQWTALLVLAYFTEGVVRAWSDTGRSQQLATAEIACALALFASCLAYIRLSRPPEPAA